MRLSAEALAVKRALVDVIRTGERWKTTDMVDQVVLFGWAQGTVVRWSIDRQALRNDVLHAEVEVIMAARFLRGEN